MEKAMPDKTGPFDHKIKPYLFIMAHAAGSAGAYRDSLKKLGRYFSLVAMDLPAHGQRNRDSGPLLSMEEIETFLVGQALDLQPSLEAAGYSIFGHSMGALCAFVLAYSLISKGYPPPRRLYVSSYGRPGWHPLPPGFSDLPDRQLWEESAARFGSLHPESPDPEEKILLFAPIMRADYKAVEAYRPPILPRPLAFPITAIYSRESDMVNEGHISAWQELSSFPLDIRPVGGSHFHALERPEVIVGIIQETLDDKFFPK
jgi:surfactin synthase thioesterase subunit